MPLRGQGWAGLMGEMVVCFGEGDFHQSCPYVTIETMNDTAEFMGQ